MLSTRHFHKSMCVQFSAAPNTIVILQNYNNAKNVGNLIQGTNRASCDAADSANAKLRCLWALVEVYTLLGVNI